MGKYHMGKLPLDIPPQISVSWNNTSMADEEDLFELLEMEDDIESDDDPKEVAMLDDMINSILPSIYSLTFCLYQMLESNEITSMKIEEYLDERMGGLIEKATQYGDKYTWPTFYIEALLTDYYGVPREEIPVKSIAKALGIEKSHDFYDDLIDIEDIFHEIALMGTEFNKNTMPIERLHKVVEHAKKTGLFNSNMNYAEWLFLADMRTPKGDDREGFGRYTLD